MFSDKSRSLSFKYYHSDKRMNGAILNRIGSGPVTSMSQYVNHGLNMVRVGYTQPEEILIGNETRYLYSVTSNDGVTQVKKHIQANGPLLAAFKPTLSFFAYRTGTYDPEIIKSEDSNAKNELGLVFVKVVGWGTDPAGSAYRQFV